MQRAPMFAARFKSFDFVSIGPLAK